MTRPKILIVDDEPFNVDYLEQELEELDYETCSASNGQAALEQVKAESPDLILLDIMMPVMDGFEVLARLKADPLLCDLPVIVISANTDLHSVVKGIQLGAEDYLPKPFEPTLLQARLSSSLEKKRLRDLEHLYLKSLERELEIGREIQQGFLPACLPAVDGWEIAAYFKSAREVAGDFYDAFLLTDGSLVCVVGDVCDKGVGAALFMTLFRSLIRVTATMDLPIAAGGPAPLGPAERLGHMLSFTNDYIAATHGDANMFATLFIGIIDLQDGTLTYANCGNEPAILSGREKALVELKVTGPVAGLFPGLAFSTKQIQLEKDDLLLIFTDGIPDARNEAEASFGREPLLRCMTGPSKSAAEMQQEIVACLESFTGAAHQFDDITLLAIKRNS